jgi:glutamate-ammonia-ligase adenylyltransferase
MTTAYGVPCLETGKTCTFTICGLGKFGGREPGYASDLEVLFLYEGEGKTGGAESLDNADYFDRLAESIVDFIRSRPEGIFHFDTRLRPFGSGAARLATSFDEFCAYYSATGDAEPFERQALIKLRWVAGNEPLGYAAEEHRHRFVYSGEPWDFTIARDLRKRQQRELVAPNEFNVKISAGGLIDIEYAVQYLQIIHGTSHEELRTPSTQAALEVRGPMNASVEKHISMYAPSATRYASFAETRRISFSPNETPKSTHFWHVGLGISRWIGNSRLSASMTK